MNEKTAQRMQMLLIPSHQVMNGFCYAFSKALLAKLKELAEEDQVFEKGAKEAEDATHSHITTSVAEAVCSYLTQQTHIDWNNRRNVAGLARFIFEIEVFLAIFER